MNAKTNELSVIARSTEAALNALAALKKSVSDLLNQDMDIISSPDEQAMMTEKQKSFLQHLFKINHPDKGELNNKLEYLESGITKQEADLIIKQYV